MTGQELVDATACGRAIWCGDCLLVRILSGVDYADRGEIMRALRCPMCGVVNWRVLTVELLTRDSRFKGLDAPG